MARLNCLCRYPAPFPLPTFPLFLFISSFYFALFLSLIFYPSWFLFPPFASPSSCNSKPHFSSFSSKPVLKPAPPRTQRFRSSFFFRRLNFSHHTTDHASVQADCVKWWPIALEIATTCFDGKLRIFLNFLVLPLLLPSSLHSCSVKEKNDSIRRPARRRRNFKQKSYPHHLFTARGKRDSGMNGKEKGKRGKTHFPCCQWIMSPSHTKKRINRVRGERQRSGGERYSPS